MLSNLTQIFFFSLNFERALREFDTFRVGVQCVCMLKANIEASINDSCLVSVDTISSHNDDGNGLGRI